MAEADLDVVIRSVTRKQVKALNDAARKRHGHLMGLAAKANDKTAKERYRHIARNTRLLAAIAGRRLQLAAENAADSYLRAIRKAAEEAAAMKSANGNAAGKPAKKKTPKQKVANAKTG